MSEISIEDVSKRFEEHLSIEENNRIIFSGKFGTGKTYFLNKFFDDRPTEYNKFIISPANYVVSSNEDIFELIKADIIKDLFVTGKVDLKQLPEDNTVQKISSFIENNQLVLGKFLLNTVSKLSSTLSIPKEIIEAIEEVFEKYKSHVKESRLDDETRSEQLVKYWLDTYDKIGNIYEHNYITELINSFLEEIKEEGKKKNVLIIDDLDRIDPDHIFRILNVLSAHNTRFDSENKFKFDYVIIVCDIKNINKIYSYRYGEEVDFDGYIDKFFSTHLFEWSNNDAIKFYISSVFAVNENEGYTSFLAFIFQRLVDNDCLTVRKLLKHKFRIQEAEFVLCQHRLMFDGYYLQRPSFFENTRNLFINNTDFKLLNFFKLMSILFGDFQTFFKSLQTLKSSNEIVDYMDVEDIILFLILNNHIAIKESDDLFVDKFYDSANHVIGINWPTSTFIDMPFTIQLKWAMHTRYNSSESYFIDARVINDKSISTMGGKSGIEVKTSLLFEALEQGIVASYKKGWFSKAGIVFKM